MTQAHLVLYYTQNYTHACVVDGGACVFHLCGTFLSSRNSHMLSFNFRKLIYTF